MGKTKDRKTSSESRKIEKSLPIFPGNLLPKSQRCQNIWCHLQDKRDMKQQFVAMKTLMEVIHSEALQGLVNAKTFKGTDATLPAT